MQMSATSSSTNANASNLKGQIALIKTLIHKLKKYPLNMRDEKERKHQPNSPDLDHSFKKVFQTEDALNYQFYPEYKNQPDINETFFDNKKRPHSFSFIPTTRKIAKGRLISRLENIRLLYDDLVNSKQHHSSNTADLQARANDYETKASVVVNATQQNCRLKSGESAYYVNLWPPFAFENKVNTPKWKIATRYIITFRWSKNRKLCSNFYFEATPIKNIRSFRPMDDGLLQEIDRLNRVGIEKNDYQTICLNTILYYALKYCFNENALHEFKLDQTHEGLYDQNEASFPHACKIADDLMSLEAQIRLDSNGNIQATFDSQTINISNMKWNPPKES